MAANGDSSEIPLREMDEDKLNDPNLVSNVANMLAKIGGEPSAEELEAAPTSNDVDNEFSDDNEDDVSQTDDDEGSEPTTVTSDDASQTTESDLTEIELPEIPDAYYRTASRYGYKPEDIKDMADKIGVEHVTTMLQNLHQKDNNLTGQFSQLGRRAKEMENYTPGQGTNPVGQQPPDLTQGDSNPATPAQPVTVDLAALKEKYGDDDPLVELYAMQANQLAAMQQSMQQLNTQLQATQTQVSQQEIDGQEQLMRDVNDFFGDKDMEVFAKFYGTLDKGDMNWTGLSPAQIANRDHVCTLADQIIAGARLHGDPMSLKDAMERAHLVVSEPISESIMRTKIMKSVEKRHKARVIRPSKSASTGKKKASSSKPASRQELIDRTNDRLSSLFRK